MLEDELFRLLSTIERIGVWLSILAWVTVAGGAVAMAYVLRHETRRAVWTAAAIVGIVALLANLTDYFVTLYRSPDLALEANPLWRNIVDSFGLLVAKWYGLTGKFLVSVLAGQMFAFYLSNQERLFPVRAASFPQFLLRMGNRSRTLRERFVGLFTVFAFFFAGIQLLYVYIAYLNWHGDQEQLNYLPSFPLAIILLLVLLAVAFVSVTYRSFGAKPALRGERIG